MTNNHTPSSTEKQIHYRLLYAFKYNNFHSSFTGIRISQSVTVISLNVLSVIQASRYYKLPVDLCLRAIGALPPRNR